jgi:hypothetical protein
MDYAPDIGAYYAIVKAEVESEAYLATQDVTTCDVNHIGKTADAMDGLSYFCEPPNLSGEIFNDGFESQ